MFVPSLTERWSRKVWRGTCIALWFFGVSVVLGYLSLGWAAPASPHALIAPDGAKIYEQRCASCHNGSVQRAPQLNVMRQKNAEDVLDALETGVMLFVGWGMPDPERKAVAEFVTGKQLGAEQMKATLSNMCPQAPGEFTVDENAPQWNGWGRVQQTLARSQLRKRG